MRIHRSIPTGGRPRLSLGSLTAVGAVSLLVAACGSSHGSASNASSQAAHGSAGAASGTAVSTTTVSGYGTVLATAKGAPLYLLTADPSGGSSCSGSCAKQWPPLVADGRPAAGHGVSGSMLSSFKRSDGTEQVLYNGHALYTHPSSTATAAAGTAADGGIWYLVSPSGKPITKTTGSGY